MRRPFLSLLLLLALGGAAPADYGPDLNARLFDRAWRLVDDHYWNRPLIAARWDALRAAYRPRILAARDRRQVYTLLGEMLATLGDSHVYAIDPVQVEIGRARDRGGEAAGFGFTMLPDGDAVWRVESVRAGGPAARAGVEIGWAVDRVDGEAVDIDFRPVPGQRARFDFIDESNTRHALTLAAESETALPERRARRLAGNVLLLALDSFEPGADRWIAGELRTAPEPSALILDLRDNGGGEAGVIARVAGLLFAEDRPLLRRVGARESVQTTRGAGRGSWLGPLAVLVGPNSASGAEAVAALVQESRRGAVVGERTAGALTGAAYYRLPDGGELAVSDFDIRTPGGARLEGVGLEPQVLVATTLADRRAGRDPVLARTLALVRR